MIIAPFFFLPRIIRAARTIISTDAPAKLPVKIGL